MHYKILKDSYPIHPRDEENLGTFLYIKNVYVSGDILGSDLEIDYYLDNKNYICVPVYAHINCSVILNNISNFSGFQSQKIGCIYVSKKQIRKDFKVKRVDKSLYNQILNFLNEEIIILNNYLNDEVFGFIITESDKEIDSCWGYYGFNAALKAAQESMNYYT